MAGSGDSPRPPFRLDCGHLRVPLEQFLQPGDAIQLGLDAIKNFTNRRSQLRLLLIIAQDLTHHGLRAAELDRGRINGARDEGDALGHFGLAFSVCDNRRSAWVRW